MNSFERNSGYEIYNEEDLEKIYASQREDTVQCSCGTKTVLANTNKAICRGCHNYVFKDKKTEFEYRVKEKMLK